MNKYQTTQASQSLCTVVATGLLASTILINEPTYSVQKNGQRSPINSISQNHSWVYNGASLTYGSKSGLLSGGYSSASNQGMESVISDLFLELSSKQEVLGGDFERVLFDNLWKLYQS
jgi:hypothetical protein